MGCVFSRSNDLSVRVVRDTDGCADSMTANVCFFGDSGAGKSTLIDVLCGRPFEPYKYSTIGAGRDVLPLCSIDESFKDRSCRVVINDMAGQERFRSLWSSYARGSHLAVLVVAADSPDWQTPDRLISMCAQFTQIENAPKLLLVASKWDLVTRLDEEHIEGLKKTLDIVYEALCPLGPRRVTVSAKTGLNMESFRGEFANQLWECAKPGGVKQWAKVVVLGHLGVGKTTFLHCAAHGTPPGRVLSTIGLDMTKILLGSEDKYVCGAYLWDTAGQERHNAITGQYLKGADVVIIVRDARNVVGGSASGDAEEYDEQLQSFRGHRFTVCMKSDLLPEQEEKDVLHSDVFFSIKDPHKIQAFMKKILLDLSP